MKECFSVYIMANAKPTLYVGVTNDLIRSVYQHKINLDPGCFTAKYCLHRLVYCEFCCDGHSASAREKQIKSMSKQEKIDLIKRSNPAVRDLCEDIAEKILAPVPSS